MVSERRQSLIQEAAGRRQPGLVLLDRVRNPHNVAAILRSCDAFGIGRVLLIQDAEGEFEPDTLGASVSRSANKWVDVERAADREATEIVRRLQAEGHSFVITAIEKAEPLTEAKLLEPNLIIGFGNERTGVSPELAALADRRVTIPMLGLTESLNVAASAAILLYEIHRQRAAAGAEHYRLPDLERERVEASWLARSKDRLNRRAAAARRRDRFTNGEF